MSFSARKVNWGVLSTAHIGPRAVIPAIQQSINGQVVAIASRSESKARETAKALGIPRSYGSYIELLQSSVVDAVYIPLPNSMHREWTIRAAEMGKHVLCEKPISMNSRECEEMILACQRHNVWLMEGFMYRFHPQIVMLREIISAGLIGRISSIRSAFRTETKDPESIRYQKELGGGALMDVGCYCVNVVRLLTNQEPIYVQGVARFNEEKNVDETFAGLMRFPNSELAVFDCGFRSSFHQAVEVVGDNGTLQLSTPFIPGDSPIIVKHSDRTDTIACETANHYRLMVEHFADCVLNDHEPRYPPTDGLNNMRIIDMLYQSVRPSSNSAQLDKA